MEVGEGPRFCVEGSGCQSGPKHGRQSIRTGEGGKVPSWPSQACLPDRLQVFAPLWALTPSQQKLKWERDVLAFPAHLPTNLKWPTVNFAV